MHITILGAGAWGTALARHFSARHEVILWTRNIDNAEAMRQLRQNARYLPGIPLPSKLGISHDLGSAITNADLLLIAVPTGGLRSLLSNLATLAWSKPLIWVCKGFEEGSGKLPHQIIEEVLPGIPCGALSGPSFALEVAKGLPTALTLASHDSLLTGKIASSLHGDNLRIYTSTDVIGVELGGAIKNVIAIAAGISDGLGFGFNARAALITRSAAEITRLGMTMGGHLETFMGLTGMGDLILTCTGELSRNRQVGLRLARGEPLNAILATIGHVAEGVTSAREVVRLAREHDVDMPISRAVYSILYENLAPRQAVEGLLHRDQKAEDPRIQ
ncbi:MAG: NAD(P)-dependent glycerol-3-phosphate dehydrogenase [Hydrogenophilaceae bacterium]|nr:NAD(P)-dependent glycerol-3-phosphate dehydrogenase [Hydrogenophilaceae bacterium]